MLAELIHALAAPAHDLEVLDGSGESNLDDMIRRTGADVVICNGADYGQEWAVRVLLRAPALRLLTISSSGRHVVMHRLLMESHDLDGIDLVELFELLRAERTVPRRS